MGKFFLAILVFGTFVFSITSLADQDNSCYTDAASQVRAKHWHIGLGPVISNGLAGTNGTKYGVSIGYVQALAEYWDLVYFYNGDFNTGSQGSTALTSIGTAGKYYFADRLSPTSFFLRADVSYGGGDRAYDSNAILGAAAGFDFFRTKPATFDFEVRDYTLVVAGASSPRSWPSALEIMFGVEF